MSDNFDYYEELHDLSSFTDYSSREESNSEMLACQGEILFLPYDYKTGEGDQMDLIFEQTDVEETRVSNLLDVPTALKTHKSPSRKRRTQNRVIGYNPSKTQNNGKTRVQPTRSCRTNETLLDQTELTQKRINRFDPISVELPDTSEEETSVKRPGRKIKLETLILNSFTPVAKSTTFKKDNLRTRMLRGHDRFLRKIGKLCRKFPTKFPEELAALKPRNYHQTRPDLNSFDRTNTDVLDLLREFISLYQSDSMLLDKTIITSPKIDQKLHFALFELESYNSYNNAYCEKYFHEYNVMQSYQLYISLVFADRSPASLCDRFGVLCCDKASLNSECSDKHKCINKWGQLEYLLRSEDFLFKSK